MRIVILAVLAVVGMLGCTYKVPTDASPALNLYRIVEDRVPARVYLVLDPSLSNVSRNLSSTSYECTAHTFPVEMGDALVQSIRHTTELVFDTVTVVDSEPSTQLMAASGYEGYVRVGLQRFEPNVSFTMAFPTPNATAVCDMALSVVFRDEHGMTLINTDVGAKRMMAGDGGFCGGGALVIADAIQDSMRETMEHYAECLGDSARIRDAVDCRVVDGVPEAVVPSGEGASHAPSGAAPPDAT